VRTSQTATVCRMLAVLILGCLAVASCNQSHPDVESPSERRMPSGVVLLRGSPQDIGRQHGTLLADRIRLMIHEYVGEDMESERLKDSVLVRVHAMKPALPEWYRQELSACAKAANVDEDVLLYAQCEGDIRSLGGCTSFVAFGAATHDGRMEIGRNFDYWGLESTDRCAVIFAVVPRPEDGYAFLSVGWTGILGGWTFLNEKGLFVSNDIGGFNEKNPQGVPTLILARIITQKAATVNEAIAIIKKTPRMRGQALVIGRAGDPATSTTHDAAVVLYGGATVEVMRSRNGFAFHTSTGTDKDRLLEILRLPTRRPTDAIQSAGTHITLHSVAIYPQDHTLWVAHGRKSSAHLGEYVKYDVRSLLQRR